MTPRSSTFSVHHFEDRHQPAQREEKLPVLLLCLMAIVGLVLVGIGYVMGRLWYALRDVGARLTGTPLRQNAHSRRR